MSESCASFVSGWDQSPETRASEIPGDILWHISEYMDEPIHHWRLVNKHWALSLAPLALKNASFDLDYYPGNLSNSIEKYGKTLRNVRFFGDYNSEKLREITFHAEKLRSLHFPFKPTQADIRQVAQNCPLISKLDFERGLMHQDVWNPNFIRKVLTLAKQFIRSILLFTKETEPSSPVSPIDSRTDTLNLAFHNFENLLSIRFSGYTQSGRELTFALQAQQNTLTELTINYSRTLQHIGIAVDFFKNLTSLDLSHSRLNTLDGSYILNQIYKGNTRIQKLNFANCYPDIGRVVTIFGINLLPDVQSALALNQDTIKQRATLKDLDVQGSKTLQFEQLVVLMTAFPGLEVLNLRRCRKVDLLSVTWLIDSCPKLRSLDLTDCHSSFYRTEFTDLSQETTPPPISFALRIASNFELSLLKRRITVFLAVQHHNQARVHVELDTRMRLLQGFATFLLISSVTCLVYVVILFI